MRRVYDDPLPLGTAGGVPYSKGLMARALVAAGAAIESATLIASRLEHDLESHRSSTVEPERLAEVAADALGEAEARRVLGRMHGLAALRELELPIVLLVGGATGTGKSTVATETAHRLGITRFTSTDFIRQTIRAYFDAGEIPSVHYSSFDADVASRSLEDGFIDQTMRVLVGVDAAIGRALTEGWSMVIEGVHLVPGMVPAEIPGALLVHAVLRVDDEDVHRSRFHVRDAATGGMRRMDRYIDRLGEIRRLQSLIVEQAERHDVPVIEASSVEAAGAELLDLVLESASRVAA